MTFLISAGWPPKVLEKDSVLWRVLLATVTSLILLALNAFIRIMPIWPVPSKSILTWSRFSRDLSAIFRAAEPRDTVPFPMPVLSRILLPAVSDISKILERAGLDAASPRASIRDDFSWPRIWLSPTIMDSSPDARLPRYSRTFRRFSVLRAALARGV